MPHDWIREEHLRSGDARQSVAVGLAAMARFITSAAVVMVCVFLAFAATESPLVKMMAVGLAVAVLVDALIVRMVLVPAAMTLLGRANWWLPRLRGARLNPRAAPLDGDG